MKQWQFMALSAIIALCALNDSAAVGVLVVSMIFFVINVWLDN